MKLITHHSAQARCHEPDHDGLIHVICSGLLCSKAFRVIAPQVLAVTRPGRALFVRLDGCITPMRELPDVVGDATTSPACLIVRPDQLDLWSAYAVKSAMLGVRRLVFLDSQIDLARQWLARRALCPALPAL